MANIGLKIGIEGDKQFRDALNEINQAFKVLGSEMVLVTSQFDKNDKSVDALTSRNSVLRKEIEAQRDKIQTLNLGKEMEDTTEKTFADSIADCDVGISSVLAQVFNGREQHRIQR